MSRPKTFPVRFTERELWFLSESVLASFTDPDEMNEHERRGYEKLCNAHAKALAEKSA